MDNLVLIRVARALDGLVGAVLKEIRPEPLHRVRLLLEAPEGLRSVVVSLQPELPWIGRPIDRRTATKQPGGPFTFASTCSKTLHGAVVAAVEKPAAERVLRFRFADGSSLLAELATHGANLVLLDSDDRIAAVARRPRRSGDRYARGSVYSTRPVPAGRLDPFGADPDEIDRFLARRQAAGEQELDALGRQLFGVGRHAARLVQEESRRSGQSVGRVLRSRLEQLLAGELDPVIEAASDPLAALSRVGLSAELSSLLPWEPPWDPPAGRQRYRRPSPPETAGLWHEAIERSSVAGDRVRGLLTVLRGEIRRTRAALVNAETDLESIQDPERLGRWGEALLAGLGEARRVGKTAFVRDPYDAEGPDLAVPVAPGVDLTEAAEALFRRRRRARRGIERSGARAAELGQRLHDLERLATEHEPGDPDSIEALERAMRRQGIPVALEPGTRAGREMARTSRPRLEGVRLFTSSEGDTILVGRNQRENHRLTFKLCSPEDFWFHAQGYRGAHVLVRNPDRRGAPSGATLEEAAAVAAWFSEARQQPRAEVQWTRRKHVRRPRGAPPGTVVLKRFETVRVRPGLPPGERGS